MKYSTAMVKVNVLRKKGVFEKAVTLLADVRVRLNSRAISITLSCALIGGT